jgi:hypothetical protein
MDSLRAEDEQPDPYLLFSIANEKGQIVRQIKTAVKKGIQRLHWDGRTNSPAPLNQRYTPGPDQLFGGAETGYLVKPGSYSLSIALYQDGKLKTLAEPKKFQLKQLIQSSIANPDLAANEEFNQRVTDARYRQAAASGRLQVVQGKLEQAQNAIRESAANPAAILEKSYMLQKDLQQLSILMNGDGTRARREFETAPSISGRIGSAQGASWSSSAPIPETQKASLAIAEKQLMDFENKLKAAEARMKEIEDELNQLKAPYYPGR